MMIGIGGADYSHWYRLQPIPLVIGPITTDTSSNRPDYEYYWCIGTAMRLTKTLWDWPESSVVVGRAERLETVTQTRLGAGGCQFARQIFTGTNRGIPGSDEGGCNGQRDAVNVRVSGSLHSDRHVSQRQVIISRSDLKRNIKSKSIKVLQGDDNRRGFSFQNSLVILIKL